MACIQYDSLAGKRVLIMGLGTKDGGVSAARFAAERGAEVKVTDLADGERLAASLRRLDDLPIQYRLGEHCEADFAAADLVIRNASIRRSNGYLRHAEAAGAQVDSPIGVFCELVQVPYVGITGSKGKSTTTHLVREMVAADGREVVAAGNNCVSPLPFLEREGIDFVLELSSYDLREMGLHRRSPHVGCWLNFFPDHLNHYGSLAEYRRDKAAITLHQSAADFLVLPSDGSLGEIETQAVRVFFGECPLPPPFERGAFFHQDDLILRWDGRQEKLLERSELSAPLRVRHYLELATAAAATAKAFGVSEQAIAQAVRTFPGLPHRFEVVWDDAGWLIINDSAATTPQSVELALQALEGERVALIYGGGGDKELAVEEVSREVRRRVERLILFRGDVPSKRLAQAVQVSHLSVVEEMAEAVEVGLATLQDWGRGALLLSPGCAGAPRFVDLFERGDRFREVVRLALFDRSGASE